MLGACGVTHPTLSASAVSSEISAQLHNLYPLVSPTVSCPSGVRDAKGQTFRCTAGLDGQTLHLTGTVTAGGRFTVAPEEAVVVVATRVAQLSADIQRQARTPAQVDCGPQPLLVVPVRGTFSCHVTFPRQKPRLVTVTEIDVKGDFGYKVSG